MPITKKGQKKQRGMVAGAVKAYQQAGKGLESVGANIRKNVDKGQKDLSSGKMPYYGSINPFKGSVDAFKQGFNAKRKLQRGMRGYKK